ncbi:MAG: hypothetical protein A2782_02535 [Candidatus Blackburnbacteria bacterium RIFCSPHIGHO2_01_FULL_43_15b]|uniref:ATP-grasp domain-containing protein n=1 Tax=Candidatus Blackburnbacteria bacterium RIFCSPHIGHO2_01_FULL_43_15b TaxID=1797513 RepID=A0A1G1V1R6_9BACT|nr:MAG: hypothetical protein A2782_02535 [Candidatus Blackburnbacteria bacterium RIFCSPHIGHO2_01_FULL_43_15b]
MKFSSILGLNARNGLFANTSARGRRIARSKIITKRILGRSGIPTPELYKVFRKNEDIVNFDWSNIPSSFALKPSKSSYGDGIIVIRKKSSDGKAWITTQRKKLYAEDFNLHILDILEGAYSIGSVPDVAFCEEYVGRHKVFRRFAYRGTPDVRIMVFNKVPVMAMLRLPTHESGGKANLHKGAIGVGIDLETGITTEAVYHGELIVYKPGTQSKLAGLKIPYWNHILEIAVKAQMVSELNLVGVDIVLSPERGPLVLEINSQPGLQIQLANLSGLRKRLEKVEDLHIHDAEHGIKVAKAIFHASSVNKKKSDTETPSVGIFEQVKIKKNGKGKKSRMIAAKIDTGAKSTAIDRAHALSLGLLERNNVLWNRRFLSSLGEQKRPVVNITFWLAGKRITTQAGVADRKRLKTPMIIGRRDLEGFVVDPNKRNQNFSSATYKK